MPDKSKDHPKREPELLCKITLEYRCMEITYAAEGQPVASTELQADTPTFQFKDGTTSPSTLDADSSVMTYESGANEDADSFTGHYEWAGRELDTNAALQYNRVPGTPDPTQGQFIEVE